MTASLTSTTADTTNHHACFIDNRWRPGTSTERIVSVDPSSGAVLWDEPSANADDVNQAVAAARAALPAWRSTPVAERRAILQRFATIVDESRATLAAAISAETGKPRWEADTEVASVIGKVDLALAAFEERTPTVEISATASLTHQPTGVMAVLGPFNFPAHLPNGRSCLR